MEDHLRQQIHIRNSHIEKLKIEIRQKDDLIAQLKLQQISSPQKLPNSSNSDELLRERIKDEVEQRLSQMYDTKTQQLQQQIKTISEQLLETQNELRKSKFENEVKLTKQQSGDDINELRESLVNARQNFKDAVGRCAILQQEVEQIREQGREFYLQKQNSLVINEPTIRTGMPVVDYQKQRKGTRFPPGTYPIAFLTPEGLPIVLFVPLDCTGDSLKQLLETQLKETLLRIHGKQQLFGFPFNPPPQNNNNNNNNHFIEVQIHQNQLIPLHGNDIILQSEFIQPYRSHKRIAIISIGEPSIISPLGNPRKSPSKNRPLQKNMTTGSLLPKPHYPNHSYPQNQQNPNPIPIPLNVNESNSTNYSNLNRNRNASINYRSLQKNMSQSNLQKQKEEEENHLHQIKQIQQQQQRKKATQTSSNPETQGRQRASTEFTSKVLKQRNPLFSGPNKNVRLKEFQPMTFNTIKTKPESSVVPMIILYEEKEYKIHFPNLAKIESIKKIILQKKDPSLSDNLAISQAIRYTLKVTGTSYYLTEGEITVIQSPIVKYCQKKHITPMLSLITKEESKNDKMISKMIGSILAETSTNHLNWHNIEDNDISDFRMRMSRLIGDTQVNYTPQLTAEINDGSSSIEINNSNNNKMKNLTVRVYLDNINDIDNNNNLSSSTNNVEHFRVTVQIPFLSFAHEVLPIVCKKLNVSMKKQIHPNDYILKVVGESCYIKPNFQIYKLAYVQSCIKKKKDIYFMLVEKKTVKCFKNHEKSDEESQLQSSPSKYEKRGNKLHQNNNKIKKSSTFYKIDKSFDQTTVDTFGDSDTVSLLELKSLFEFKIISVDNLQSIMKKNDLNLLNFYVSAGIYFAGEQINPYGISNDDMMMNTKIKSINSNGNVIFRQWLRSSIKICNLPEDSRLCITLYESKSSSSQSNPIAWVNCSLFDFKDHFRTGDVSLRMWIEEKKANPIGTCMENLRSSNESAPIIKLSFHTFPLNISYPNLKAYDLIQNNDSSSSSTNILQNPSSSDATKMQFLVNSDPLYKLTNDDKKLLWKYREWLRKFSLSRSLVKILQCVHWYDISYVRETYRLLSYWKSIDPVDALQLLDAQFANRKVRQFAVSCLDKLSDYELRDYLLQLVQALKYEPNHFSPLAVWLLHRSLQNPMLLGIEFFWMLKSELHVPEISERYALLLEMYLRGCGDQRNDLYKQTCVISKLNDVAIAIKSVSSARRKQELQKKLSELDLPKVFQLPLDPKRSASGLIIEKCKSMDSAKAPLWLVFKNADPRGSNIWLIFKSGDDLRQDLLTLQMLGIMDNIWKKDNLDLCLTPYKCIATGDEMGMIETVLDSTTTAAIQKAAGGVTGALKQTPLANWLRKYNPGDCKFKKTLPKTNIFCN